MVVVTELVYTERAAQPIVPWEKSIQRLLTLNDGRDLWTGAFDAADTQRLYFHGCDVPGTAM